MICKEDNRTNPDIIDYDALDKPRYLSIDEDGNESPQDRIVPIIVQEKQKGGGRRKRTELEFEYFSALCLAVRQAVYAIQALGYSPRQAKNKIEKTLTALTVKQAIEEGGKISSSRLNVNSASELKQIFLNQYKINQFFRGNEKFREQRVKDELAIIELLNVAYLSALSKMGKMYNAQTYKRKRTIHSKRITAWLEETSPCLSDCMAIAVRTKSNPAFLWPKLWQYGYLFEAGNIIERVRSGFVFELSALQLYVLFRMCEDELPAKPEDYDEYAKCRHIIMCHIAVFGGLEGTARSQVINQTELTKIEEAERRLQAFRRGAQMRLEKYKLLNPRPKSVIELIDRTSAVPETIAKLYPLKQSK